MVDGSDMEQRFRVLLVGMPCLLVALAAGLQAQEPEQPPAPATPPASATPAAPSPEPGLKTIFRDFLHDERRLWTAPFRGGSYSKYAIGGIVTSGLLMTFDRRISDIAPNTTDQSRWAGRVSQMGASYTLFGAAAGTYLFGRITKNKKARETGYLGMLALAHTQIITQVIKQSTNRERPGDSKAASNGGLGFWRGGVSFPSGHSSGAFALATVFSYEYGPRHRWVPFVAYGLSSGVAVSRMAAQQHWSSDVFVGGILGFLVGRYVHHHHGTNYPDRFAGVQRAIPQVGYSQGVVSLSWQPN